MRNTKALCQTAVVAALYVALTTLNPLSWGVIQFRVANMLCALPFKDKRYAPAVLLGIAIANATSPFGPVDVLFGLLAEGDCIRTGGLGAVEKAGDSVESSHPLPVRGSLHRCGTVCDGRRAVLVDKRWPVRGHIPGRGTGKFDDLQNCSRKGGVRGARRWLCKGPALFLWNNTTARADTGTENEEG